MPARSFALAPLLAVFALAACGGSGSDDVAEGAAAASTNPPRPPPTNDAGPLFGCDPPNNGSLATATVYADFTDAEKSPRSGVSRREALGPREAWYKFELKDEGMNGDPELRARVSHELEVTVFFTCRNGGDANTCEVGEAVTENGMAGCKGISAASLMVSCNSADDGGSVVVRVRRREGDRNVCSTYALDLDTT